MSNLLIGLLSALVATNQPAALSNFLAQTTGALVNAPDPNDPVEKEYKKLLEQDDAAQEEVDKWVRDEAAFREQGAGLPGATLRIAAGDYDMNAKLRQFIGCRSANPAGSACNKCCQRIGSHLQFPFQILV